MNEPRGQIVKVWASKHGVTPVEFSISTQATSDVEFLLEASNALVQALTYPTNPEYMLKKLLPQICNIWAKYRGYRADVRIYEAKLFVSGCRPDPETTMEQLNTIVSWDEPGSVRDPVPMTTVSKVVQ